MPLTSAFRPPTSDLQAGIPIAWFHEIDHACDRFFEKRGINLLDFREQIALDMDMALARRPGGRGDRATDSRISNLDSRSP